MDIWTDGRMIGGQIKLSGAPYKCGFMTLEETLNPGMDILKRGGG